MNTNCPLGGFLATADAEQLLDYLVEEVQDEQDGLQAMRWLLANRAAVAHTVLCRLYDVACYQVGETCFRDIAPADEHDKWFVATLVEADFDDVRIPYGDSQSQAESLAVTHLRLADKFFGTEALAA